MHILVGMAMKYKTRGASPAKVLKNDNFSLPAPTPFGPTKKIIGEKPLPKPIMKNGLEVSVDEAIALLTDIINE